MWFKITPVEIVLVSLAGDLKVLTFLHNFLIVDSLVRKINITRREKVYMEIFLLFSMNYIFDFLFSSYAYPLFFLM